jgi:hypothetical protein
MNVMAATISTIFIAAALAFLFFLSGDRKVAGHPQRAIGEKRLPAPFNPGQMIARVQIKRWSTRCTRR